MLVNYLTLLWVLLVVGLVLAGLTVRAMAIILLRPPRMTDGRAAWRLKRLSPGDLRLTYSDVTYEVRDELTGDRLKLTAWWIPSSRAADRCAILLHGYSDAKVGAIAWAPTLHDLGFNILALDLRAHGGSEGIHSTAGFFERHDVSQVIDQLRREKPGETRQIVLFGVSLGAAVAAATAVLRDDIAAVVMECPFSDYASAAASHANVVGAPGGSLQTFAYQHARKMARADFSAVRPVDLIPQIPCPLLVIRSEVDVFISNNDAALVEAATRSRGQTNGPTVYWNAENAHHVAALYEDPVEYQKRLGAFFHAALKDVLESPR